jgi:hypothetical protein
MNVDAAYDKNLNEIKEKLCLIMAEMNKAEEVEKVNWGHVGSLGHVNDELNNLCMFLFGEGK